MILISGTVARVDIKSIPAYIDILIHGAKESFVGHRVYCTTKTTQKIKNSRISLDTTVIYREESLTIYGFTSKNEKQLFDLLLKAKGIGGNTAILIMDCVEDKENLFDAISNEDISYFEAFKGIGKATARNIIDSLKNKIKKKR